MLMLRWRRRFTLDCRHCRRYDAAAPMPALTRVVILPCRFDYAAFAMPTPLLRQRE